MLLAQRILDMAYFRLYPIITAICCPLSKYTIQMKPAVMRDQRACDYQQQHWIEMLALPRQNAIRPLSARPSSPNTPILRLLLEYWMFRIWKTGKTKNFDMNIIASHHKSCVAIISTVGRYRVNSGRLNFFLLLLNLSIP